MSAINRMTSLRFYFYLAFIPTRIELRQWLTFAALAQAAPVEPMIKSKA